MWLFHMTIFGVCVRYLGVNGALLSASDDEVAVVTIQKNRFLELEDCMKTVGFLETVSTKILLKNYKNVNCA